MSSKVSSTKYADVIIPLAVKHTYSYVIPDQLIDQVKFGVRVEVPFGKKKLYAALVVKVHDSKPDYETRDILSVLDDEPVINKYQLDLWYWISSYYLCGLGEVMSAALPSRLKLNSETIITPGSKLDDNIFDLDDHGYMIAEAVSIQKELTIDQVRDILNIKTVYPVIKRLLENQIIDLKEELQTIYQAKTVKAIKLGPLYYETKDQKVLFELVHRSDHQTRALLSVINLSRSQNRMTQQEIMTLADVSHQVMAALEKKGLIERYDMEVSRIDAYDGEIEMKHPLSGQQTRALEEIETCDPRPILIHGVTGSGKTRVYVELMQKALHEGRQVLYLLPEIALTTQVVSRLKKIFADNLLLYHSKLNENERVEVWKQLQGRPRILLGARSGLFLPFDDLGLIVVDEEHDGSYKQQEPNPRYQARDAAVVLARLHGCQIVMGSGTPSVESYHNVVTGKYKLVEMPDRFGSVKMPEIKVVDLKKGSKSGHFSRELLDAIESTKNEKGQTILFQNRRGFAPLMFCGNCGWSLLCQNCDISLTYHQYTHEMQCHLCGYHEKPPLTCPACGNHELGLKGFGTEMIEDEIKIRFPDYKVGRLDLDTARGKKQLEKIISAFERRDLDVLIGTQMVSKGLDFDSVMLVSIINADHLLYYPDFRAAERAFQLMTQVSGRAGRRKKQGDVIIQAYNVTHPVIKDVIRHDFKSFFDREILERKEFGFPPFIRIIDITTKHRQDKLSQGAAVFIVKYLSQRIGNRVKGPIKPGVSRVRNRYIYNIVVKLEKHSELIRKTKTWIDEAVIYVRKQKGMSTLRVSVNVDP